MFFDLIEICKDNALTSTSKTIRKNKNFIFKMKTKYKNGFLANILKYRLLKKKKIIN